MPRGPYFTLAKYGALSCVFSLILSGSSQTKLKSLNADSRAHVIQQTNFLYFGDINIDFAFHLFFFARYSKMLELSTFHGRASDFVFMLLTIAGLLLVSLPFLAWSILMLSKGLFLP